MLLDTAIVSIYRCLELLAGQMRLLPILHVLLSLESRALAKQSRTHMIATQSE